MLTRLQVQGFKSLHDLTIRFGPFTCIAGLNATGKSNLFDAIRFLHLLTQKPILEAVASLRHTGGKSHTPEELFTRFGSFRAEEMRFVADLLIERKVEDDFGVPAEAAISTLRYTVAFRLGEEHPEHLELAHESLEPIKLSDARKSLSFPHSKEFRDSVVGGRRTTSFVSTAGPERTITVHQEGHGGRTLPAPRSTRTVVGGLANSDFPTVLAANREMASWKTLMLEPSAMRTPSGYRDPRQIDSRGAHVPNAVRRLSSTQAVEGMIESAIANRLSKLVEDVESIRVQEDDRTETRTLALRGRDGVFHPAHALSDGTLRFLVLSVLELDPQARGVICLEEPENGIHPERIASIVELLKDIAVDPDCGVDADNPLRQVVINTHSPLVVQNVPIDDLIYLEQERHRVNGTMGAVTTAFVPSETWRANDPDSSRLVPGQILSYLGQGRPREDEKRQLVFDWLETARGTR